MTQSTKFNAAQRIAADSYGDGDYGYFDTMEDVEQTEEAGDLGDTLFLFVMRELGETDDHTEQVDMIRRAAGHLDELADKLQAELPEDEGDAVPEE